MTDLLPIVFSRGQNEGVDPRVADPSTLSVVNNARWRKDGRPAKRYGWTQYTSTGFDQVGSTSWSKHAVNFIDQWRGQPIIGIGGTTRRLIKGATWSDIGESTAAYGSYWGPGRRDTVAYSDQAQYQNSTVAYCNGYVFTAWDDGTSTYWQISTIDGAIVVAKGASFTGTYPRAVSPSGSTFVHLVLKNGTTINCFTFDMSSATFTGTGPTALGTLASSAQLLDAYPRASDWLLAYQSATAQLTVKLVSSASTPAATTTATVSTSASPGNIRLSVAANGASSGIVLCWLESGGLVRYAGFDNTLSALTSAVTVETNAANSDTPVATVSQFSPFAASLFWGAAAAPMQVRWASITFNAGTFGGSVAVIQNVRPCSRPFYGNSADSNLNDSTYIWVTTDNGTGVQGWFDQRTFHLLSVPNIGTPKSVLWTPSLVGSLLGAPNTTGHINDVVSDGSSSNNTTYWTTFQQAARYALNTVDGLSVELVSFKSLFARQRESARDTVTAGRALQISGGVLYEFNGYLEESGFMHAPVILSATATAGGSLTGPATYLYRAVYEWVDLQGRRHRSAPSDPATLTTTSSNKTGTLSIAPLTGYCRIGLPSLHIYRTLAGGATYQRVSPNTGVPSAVSASAVNYVDSLSDASAAVNEFIYTDGGVVPNDFPPPSTFMCSGNGRVWLGGGFERNVITASKLLVDGEPTQFSLEAEFSVYLPEECTGLASLDGTVVAFGRESVYLVTGDGPDDQGNGTFSDPQKLPTDVGCIDWRSIVTYSEGVVFQSKRGIFLLPRGFNTPVFIGSAVEDTVNSFPICLSATLVQQAGSIGKQAETTIRFVMASTERVVIWGQTTILVYDPRTQGWSIDSSADTSFAYGPAGYWLDTFVLSKISASANFNSLWHEDSSSYADNGNGITTLVKTGDVRPFGVAGYGQFKSVIVVGEFRASTTVDVLVSIDGGSPEFFQLPVSAADGADGVTYFDVTPQIQKGSSIRITVQDFNATPGEGFIPQAVMIETANIGGPARLAQGRKA